IVLNDGVGYAVHVDIDSTLTSTGVIDLNHHDVVGDLDLARDVIGSVVNGGEISGTVDLSDTAGGFAGSAAFTTVSGTLSAYDPDGTLTLTGDVTGTVAAFGAMSGAIDIGGDISSGASVLLDSGLKSFGHVNVAGSNAGTIEVAGPLTDNSVVKVIGGLE